MALVNQIKDIQEEKRRMRLMSPMSNGWMRETQPKGEVDNAQSKKSVHVAQRKLGLEELRNHIRYESFAKLVTNLIATA